MLVNDLLIVYILITIVSFLVIKKIVDGSFMKNSTENKEVSNYGDIVTLHSKS